MVRKSKGLGERQQKIIKFIEKYQKKYNHPPSITEIGKACDISSVSVIHYYLDQLEKAGYLERDRESSTKRHKKISNNAMQPWHVLINIEFGYVSLAGDSTTNAPPPTSSSKKKKPREK